MQAIRAREYVVLDHIGFKVNFKYVERQIMKASPDHLEIGFQCPNKGLLLLVKEVPSLVSYDFENGNPTGKLTP
jgi:hypothetical protein